MNNWYKMSQEVQEPIEYMIEKGILYDIDGEDVFSIKELLRYNVPLFKSPQQANEFLEKIETITKKHYGRVPETDYLKTLRYKDTRKEKEQAKREYMDKLENRI